MTGRDFRGSDFRDLQAFLDQRHRKEWFEQRSISVDPQIYRAIGYLEGHDGAEAMQRDAQGRLAMGPLDGTKGFIILKPGTRKGWAQYEYVITIARTILQKESALQAFRERLTQLSAERSSTERNWLSRTIEDIEEEIRFTSVAYESAKRSSGTQILAGLRARCCEILDMFRIQSNEVVISELREPASRTIDIADRLTEREEEPYER